MSSDNSPFIRTNDLLYETGLELQEAIIADFPSAILTVYPPDEVHEARLGVSAQTDREKWLSSWSAAVTTVSHSSFK